MTTTAVIDDVDVDEVDAEPIVSDDPYDPYYPGNSTPDGKLSIAYIRRLFPEFTANLSDDEAMIIDSWSTALARMFAEFEMARIDAEIEAKVAKIMANRKKYARSSAFRKTKRYQKTLVDKEVHQRERAAAAVVVDAVAGVGA